MPEGHNIYSMEIQKNFDTGEEIQFTNNMKGSIKMWNATKIIKNGASGSYQDYLEKKWESSQYPGEKYTFRNLGINMIGCQLSNINSLPSTDSISDNKKDMKIQFLDHIGHIMKIE